MQQFLLLLSLLSVHNMITTCHLSMTVNSQSAQQSSKPSSKNIMLKISLLSREENLSLLGVSPQPSRDIGFANVFLSLENHQETNQTIIIQNIEIRNISDNQLQPFRFEPRKIELKPLENSIIDIHLTNKTGYLGEDQVKAVVTYQIGNQVEKIESEVVDIDRH